MGTTISVLLGALVSPGTDPGASAWQVQYSYRTDCALSFRNWTFISTEALPASRVTVEIQVRPVTPRLNFPGWPGKSMLSVRDMATEAFCASLATISLFQGSR